MEANEKKIWLGTYSNAAGIQQVDCRHSTHLSYRIGYLVAVCNQYVECEKQRNNNMLLLCTDHDNTHKEREDILHTMLQCSEYIWLQ